MKAEERDEVMAIEVYRIISASNLVLIAGVLIFAIGFFPYKPFIPGSNEFSTVQNLDKPSAPFDKVIFMVVDALRRTGNALPFTAHASSPTITMPKVKAITTGSVPSFLDVILNFAESDTSSTLSHIDTWLSQLRNQPRGNLVMYGDDTWLKLFPNFFGRSDGTSSFFVSDFTEVDQNVTRHLTSELSNSDWNGWIMHYLGLDHIGHKSGPHSPHMRPKQEEMDNVVRTIYEGLETKDHLSSTLLVICGDHGMNEAGNHGGAAPGETSPALVFVSPKLRALESEIEAPSTPIGDFNFYNTVEQSDIVPTLCALLGIPIPMNNLGVIIPEVLNLWTENDDRQHLLEQNTEQIHRIVKQTWGHDTFSLESLQRVDCKAASSELEQIQCSWLAQETRTYNNRTRTDILYTYLRLSQESLSSASSNYDTSKLAIGVLLLATLTVVHSWSLTTLSTTVNDFAGFAFGIIVTCLYSFTMFASSFVEEEHQYWHWIGNLLALYLFVLRPIPSTRSAQSLAIFVLFSVLLRTMRRWNQTGQKFAGQPDISRSIVLQNPILLWSLVLITHTYVGFSLISRKISGLPNYLSEVLSVAIVILAFVFKLSFTAVDAPELVEGIAPWVGPLATASSLVYQARLVFLLIFCCLAVICFRPGNASALPAIRDHITMFLLVQTRINNIPLLLIFDLLARCIQFGLQARSQLSSPEFAICSLILQYASFFALGGTNAISSIDLSNAYNGVSGYNVMAVGLLTFISNWVGPIWWTVTSFTLFWRYGGSFKNFTQYAALTHLFVCGSLSATMLACTLLRSHLFIWTVFSPKYLYSMAWTIAQHLVVNTGAGFLLFWYHTE